VEAHDGAVAERPEQVDLAVEALQLAGAPKEVVHLHPVPRHLHAPLLVEGPIPARHDDPWPPSAHDEHKKK
jgi:hypothetical protein